MSEVVHGIQRLEQQLRHIEREIEALRRAEKRDEVRDMSIDLRLQSVERLQGLTVELMRLILQELRRRPNQFPASTGLTIRRV